MEKAGVGIIGGGLMGREVASGFARWCALTDVTVQPELIGVADLNPKALGVFRSIPSARLLVEDYRRLLDDPAIEVIYAAVPHHFHEQVYLDVLRAGKDLLAEKPFGIDLAAARRIHTAATESGRFVRCSSEFPFMPGALRVFEAARSGHFGRILEVVSGFHHSSDLDATKAANWKRQTSTCGTIGVMGDLGMHVCHVPLRLGWNPVSVYAQLLRGYETRPDGKGGSATCDTFDNAVLNTWTQIDAHAVPLRFEMKRLAPGQTNTWFLDVLGTEGGARYSTRDPKALWQFEMGKEQSWKRTDLGFATAFKAVTGGIFEVGFPDLLQQMWASYLEERAGNLNGRLGCVLPEEAVRSHELFDAALQSHKDGRVVGL